MIDLLKESLRLSLSRSKADRVIEILKDEDVQEALEDYVQARIIESQINS